MVERGESLAVAEARGPKPHHHTSIVVCLVFLLLALAGCEKIFAGGSEVQHEAAPNELLVTFSPSATPESIEQINEKLGVEVIDRMFGGRIQHVRTPPGVSVDHIKAAYASYQEVESVEPNYRVRVVK